MVFEKVAALIAEKTQRDVSEITMESLFETFGFDSLETVEILMMLEEELGCELKAEGYSFKTVGEFVGMVEKQLEESKP